MAHLCATHQWHRVRQPWRVPSFCKHRFALRLVGATQHWQGIHEHPQCKRGECHNDGVLVDDPEIVTDLRTILKRCSKQYADGELGDPRHTPFDAELDANVVLNWFNLINDYS